MKRFQRWFGILLAGSMLLTLAACGQQAQKPAEQNPETQNNAGNTVVSEQESSLKNEGTPSDSQGKKTLVVSYSATGNTEVVAEYVAENLGADIFEITPVDPYTDDDLDYTNEDSRVVYEYENPDARNVELAIDSVENWADYDTVLIGYPIWWYIAAWPVDSFVRVNDFTGKTVIPFAHLLAPVWVKAENFWLNWRVPETGRKDEGSQAVPMKRRRRNGLMNWVLQLRNNICNGCKIEGKKNGGLGSILDIRHIAVRLRELRAE